MSKGAGRSRGAVRRFARLPPSWGGASLRTVAASKRACARTHARTRARPSTPRLASAPCEHASFLPPS
eukprot:7619213-Alexandrium_andersonii.AAC.1